MMIKVCGHLIYLDQAFKSLLEILALYDEINIVDNE